ncbi:hypothetical protein Bbelb_073680 [Branchiostoma belcheri]|nr:hypothetical protein Bbelb_073680 [Branchiostoma belcheri]
MGPVVATYDKIKPGCQTVSRAYTGQLLGSRANIPQRKLYRIPPQLDPDPLVMPMARWGSGGSEEHPHPPPHKAERNLAATALEVPSSSEKNPPFKILATGMVVGSSASVQKAILSYV